ncbi:fatty acid cis/trans isomerase [Vibrio sp.]|nr:fatty acid cis/trans isomerase [Vibrio sp.]
MDDNEEVIVKRVGIIIGVLLLAGCSVFISQNFNTLYGEPEVKQRTVSFHSPQADNFLSQVQPILDNRCVVCHACYDAPCQLKLSSPAGIDRGAHKALVYDGTRLTPQSPTRLFQDAQTTQEWRDLGFSPVLNERKPSAEANLHAGVMARLLQQKQTNPLPDVEVLEGFDFNIDRVQTCPTIGEYEEYAQKNPLWGMPYGLPALPKQEYNTLINWLADGAPLANALPISKQEQNKIDEVEHFLNQPSLKSQISARYIYEHLFLSHLYFSELGSDSEPPRFFQLVRSHTPPGESVKPIFTRRPYDDPQTERVYYRLIPIIETIVDKTHMPYEMSHVRLEKWKSWFIDAEYSITELPSYKTDIAANPMTAYHEIPVHSRYRFMLDEAQNTIMSFIKGPVCRGQLALNVINDRFWVFFADPELTLHPDMEQFYRDQAKHMRLPAEVEDTFLPASHWVKYSKRQASYLAEKSTLTNEIFKDGQYLNQDIIWSGDGDNFNATLTVLRHHDSASVAQGLLGTPPKTAWIIDYGILERIHYLLVAGFDVYGNYGHQLITRMYMDFLRMEGESNFIGLLPKGVRESTHNTWYEDKSPELKDFMLRNVDNFTQPTQIPYHTTHYAKELMMILSKSTESIQSTRYQVTDTFLSKEQEDALDHINTFIGEGFQYVPPIVTIMVEQDDDREIFTLFQNSAHKNISSLFNEKGNRKPKNDSLTLVRGVLGSYPESFFKLSPNNIDDFVEKLSRMDSPEDYTRLLNQYGVRRTSSNFWSFSDKLHHWYRTQYPIEFGILDYNRFENQ